MGEPVVPEGIIKFEDVHFSYESGKEVLRWNFV